MRKQPSERIEHVGRGEGGSVAKGHAFPQMERVASSILRLLPRFGQRGGNANFPAFVGLHLHQAIEDVRGNGVMNRGALEVHRIRFFLDGNEIAGLLCCIRWLIICWGRLLGSARRTEECEEE